MFGLCLFVWAVSQVCALHSRLLCVHHQPQQHPPSHTKHNTQNTTHTNNTSTRWRDALADLVLGRDTARPVEAPRLFEILEAKGQPHGVEAEQRLAVRDGAKVERQRRLARPQAVDHRLPVVEAVLLLFLLCACVCVGGAAK